MSADSDEAVAATPVRLHRDDLAGAAAVTGGLRNRETAAVLDDDAAGVPEEVRHLADVITEARMRGIRFGPYTLARIILDAGYRREVQP
ncbi:hypothetical protein [Micromonospora tulbaghiae]|uniref:hypothetical protein n=1 Tax=Micromonospora tulbaghiae TaxID=479978 RepID=UPI0034102952